MMQTEKVIEIKEMAKILEMDEKVLQNDAKTYAGTTKGTVNLDGIVRMLVGNLLTGLSFNKMDAKNILDKANINFSNPSEVVRILDNGILVIKLRFQKLRRELLTRIDQALISEEVRTDDDKQTPDDEEKKEDV